MIDCKHLWAASGREFECVNPGCGARGAKNSAGVIVAHGSSPTAADAAPSEPGAPPSEPGAPPSEPEAPPSEPEAPPSEPEAPPSEPTTPAVPRAKRRKRKRG